MANSTVNLGQAETVKVLWKIYNIHSGKMLKAGFEDEDEAKEWLEARDHLPLEDYLVEEMDPDEEEDPC